MDTVKSEGMTIQATEFEDQESVYPRHVERQSVILSLCDWSGTIEQMTTVTISRINGSMTSVQFQRFRKDVPTINFDLASDEASQMIHVLQGDNESRQIESLRAAHDALNADLATSQDMVRHLNTMNDHLGQENYNLQNQVYKASAKCGKAVNHAEILERRAKELLQAANAQIALWEQDDNPVPANLRLTAIRLDQYLDDCAAHRQLEAMTPGGDSPDEVEAIRQENEIAYLHSLRSAQAAENEALKRRIEQLQYAVMTAYMNIENGHASFSRDVLVGMHPYEDDPYGLRHLPKEEPGKTPKVVSWHGNPLADQLADLQKKYAKLEAAANGLKESAEKCFLDDADYITNDDIRSVAAAVADLINTQDDNRSMTNQQKPSQSDQHNDDIPF